jgi:hypothetical protein
MTFGGWGANGTSDELCPDISAEGLMRIANIGENKAAIGQDASSDWK